MKQAQVATTSSSQLRLTPSSLKEFTAKSNSGSDNTEASHIGKATSYFLPPSSSSPSFFTRLFFFRRRTLHVSTDKEAEFHHEALLLKSDMHGLGDASDVPACLLQAVCTPCTSGSMSLS